MIPPLHCPFGACPLARRSFPCLDSVVGHINTCHSGSFSSMTDAAFHRLTLHPCQHFGKVFKDQTLRDRHVRNEHRVTRSKTNSELVAERFPIGSHHR